MLFTENNIKAELSYAYLHAIAAWAGSLDGTIRVPAVCVLDPCT